MLLPNSKKWHQIAITISAPYRYLMTVMVLGALLAVWFLCCYQPLQKHIAFYTAQIAQQHKELHHVDKVAHEQHTIKHENELLEEKLATFNDTGARSTNIAYVTYVLEHAATAGCRIDNYTIQQKQATQKKFYRKTFLTISLQTTLEQLIRFFTLLKESEKMISFQLLSLEQTDTSSYTAQLTLAFITAHTIKNPST